MAGSFFVDRGVGRADSARRSTTAIAGEGKFLPCDRRIVGDGLQDVPIRAANGRPYFLPVFR